MARERSAQRPPWPRRRRRLVFAGMAAGAMLVVVLGIAVVMRTATFRDWLRHELVARARAATRAEVSVGGLEGDLLGTLVLTDVRVRLDGMRVFAARRVTARYHLLGLLLGRGLGFDAVTVDGVALTLVLDERGWNVARLSTTETGRAAPASAVGLRVADLTVTGGALKIVRPEGTWRFRDVALAAAGEHGAAGSVVSVRAASFVVPARALAVDALVGRLALGADGTLVADGVRFATAASELRGRARIGGDARGELDVSVESAHLDLAEVGRALGRPLGAVAVAGRLTARGPRSAVAVEAALTSAAGALAVGGTIDLLARPLGYDLHATATRVNVADLLGPAAPATELDGTLSARGAGLRMADADGTLSLALADSLVAGRRIVRLDAGATLRARRVDFDASAVAETGTARVNGSVDVATSSYQLQVALDDFDPAPLVGRPELRARVSATLTGQGSGFTLADARAAAHLEVARSRVGDWLIDAGAADLRAAEGWLTIDRLALRSTAARALVSGTLALGGGTAAGGPGVAGGRGRDVRGRGVGARDAGRPDIRGSVRYQLEVDDLRPLAAAAGVGPLAGAATLSGTAGGSLEAVDAHLLLSGRRLTRERVAADTLALELDARALGAPQASIRASAHIEDLRLLGRRCEGAALAGEWSAGRARLEVRVREDPAHLHELAASATVEPAATRIEIERLRLDLDGETWRADGRPAVVWRGDGVATDGLTLRSGSALVRVEGEVGGRGAQDLRVAVEGLDLDRLGAVGGEGLGGRVRAQATVGGTAGNPTIDAELAVEAPHWRAVAWDSARLALHARAGRAALTGGLVQSPGRELALDAVLPIVVGLAPFRVDTDGELAGRVRAVGIDLVFLEPFLDAVSDLRGTLDADLALGGSLAAPELRGPVEIAGGRVSVPLVGVTYEPITLRAHLDGRVLAIDDLRIGGSGGTLAASGVLSFAHEGGAPTDLRIELGQFPLLANLYGHGAASGVVRVGGSGAAPVVEGRLETADLVLRIPETLPGTVRAPDPTITVIGGAASGPPAVPPPSTGMHAAGVPALYDRARIDVRLAIARDAWIRRSDANVELRGEITASKVPSEALRLRGEIRAVRGWYAFEGKTFTFTEGRVTFTGEGVDPLLHLVAERTSGEYTIRVTLGGTIGKPALTLASEPALEQADVLALVLFGRPTDQLSRAESTGLREQAIGIAANYAARELRQSTAEALGVDDLQFESGEPGVTDAKVSLGKYLAEDVFVSLAHRFGKQRAEEIRLEYRMTPEWSIETSSDTLGDSGIDLLWRRRY